MCNPRMPLPRQSIRDVRSPALTPCLVASVSIVLVTTGGALGLGVWNLVSTRSARINSRGRGIGAPDRSQSQNTDQTGEASSRHASNLIGFMRAGLRQLAGVERSQSHQAEARAPVCCLPAAFSQLRPADREATGGRAGGKSPRSWVYAVRHGESSVFPEGRRDRFNCHRGARFGRTARSISICETR